MDIFLELSKIGQEQIVPIFDGIYQFFSMPLSQILNNFDITQQGADLFTKILAFISGAPLNYESVSPLATFFELVGVDLTIPLWQFLVTNIGWFLVLSIISLVLNAIPLI